MTEPKMITIELPRVFTMESPLFGPCRLLPHGMDEEPQSPIGYVALDGQPDTVTFAVHHGGEWRGRDLKPFSRPVTTWYSVEKADGSPVF